MLKANKTYTYALPLVQSKHPGRTYVRTGTYPDGNCFIHALLRAIDSSYRKQNSHYAHNRLVERFRRDLSEWLTPDIFQTLGQGEQLRLNFLTALDDTLRAHYATPPVDATHAYVELIHELLPLDVIDREILPEILKVKSENFYLDFGRAAEQHLRRRLTACDPAKVDRLVTRTYEYFIDVFEDAHRQSLVHFQARLAKMGEYVDAWQMECISRYTGYNFLFVRDDTQLPYDGLQHVVSFDPTRKCLVFVWLPDGDHFEILGELEEQQMINRIFVADDPLIEELRAPVSDAAARPDGRGPIPLAHALAA
jgi:hypothetical protein